MEMTELDQFLEAWNRESENTLRLLKALPTDQYDFRPDVTGRSMGELAWHLAEGDAYIRHGIVRGEFNMSMRPPGIERPMSVELLAPEFERVHRESVSRIRELLPDD